MTKIPDESASRSEKSSGKKLRVLGRDFPIPSSRQGRMVLGFGLIIGGLVGFLPVVGFWMLPLGVLVLSQDIPIVRRWRRKLAVKFLGRREKQGRRR